MSAPVFDSRRGLQPGKSRPDRVSAAVGPRARRAIAWLPEGETLYDAVVSAFLRFGVRAGAFSLLGGRLSTAAYHVAKPRDDSLRVVEYGPPIRIEGGANIIRATGSYGDDLSGRPLLHIHGVLGETGGRAHGGHIAPDICVIGSVDVRAVLNLTVGFKQSADRETGFALFFPFSEAAPNA